jgi:hypothetical protein
MTRSGYIVATFAIAALVLARAASETGAWQLYGAAGIALLAVAAALTAEVTK